MRRQGKSTLCQLLAPVIFLLALWAIDVAVKAGASENRHPEPFLTMKDGDPTSPGVIPRCRVYDTASGRYGQGNAIPGAWCTSVIYAPSNVVEVNSIMSEMARRRQFTFASGLADASKRVPDEAQVAGFQTEALMRQYLRTYPGRVAQAVLFRCVQITSTRRKVRLFALL